MTILVDTNILLAYAFTRDANHARASDLIRSVGDEAKIIVAPVLTELFYMTTLRISYPRAIQVFAAVRSAFQIEALSEPDMDRMQAIMAQYQDAEFDFADVAIMAISERLNITRVFTFDRRDFAIFRPTHCDYLNLVPE